MLRRCSPQPPPEPASKLVTHAASAIKVGRRRCLASELGIPVSGREESTRDIGALGVAHVALHRSRAGKAKLLALKHTRMGYAAEEGRCIVSERDCRSPLLLHCCGLGSGTTMGSQAEEEGGKLPRAEQKGFRKEKLIRYRRMHRYVEKEMYVRRSEESYATLFSHLQGARNSFRGRANHHARPRTLLFT